MREKRIHSASPARRGAADNDGEEYAGAESRDKEPAALARSKAAKTKKKEVEEEEKEEEEEEMKEEEKR